MSMASGSVGSGPSEMLTGLVSGGVLEILADCSYASTGLLHGGLILSMLTTGGASRTHTASIPPKYTLESTNGSVCTLNRVLVCEETSVA